MSRLILDLHVGDTLVLDGGRITISLRDKSGRRAKLAVEADSSVSVRRQRSALEGARADEMPRILVSP